MNKGIISFLVMALMSQCQARMNMCSKDTDGDLNCIDSLTIIYDPEICPGEVEKYVAQSAEKFLTYTDLPKIVERNDSVLNSFIKDISKAQISDQTYIDTDLAVFIHKHNDIDTLVLGRYPNCSCELNSKHVCCPEAYLDIVEIVMKTDDEWRHRYINELKIMSKYYFSSEELQRVPGDRVRRLITAYDF